MALPSTARVVIIGGGAVGVSGLYHLAKAGWKDCVLIEKNELTSGSTWHAAGNCPTFAGSWAVMNMQRYSTELYRGLADEVDYPMNYHVTGSIRIGHSKERTEEFKRVMGMGRYQGIDMHMMTQAEAKEMYPFLEMHDLDGILYDPTDGDIDPAQLTQALAKGARAMGGHIERFCALESASFDPTAKEWTLKTTQGEIKCEYVVNAAGYRAQEVGQMLGNRWVPMVSMSHQYLLTDPVPEVEEFMKSNGGKKLPLLRDVDSSYYLRQEKTGFNLGPYELNCKAHWITPEDPMPEDFSFQLWEDDLDRLEWYIEDAMARVPQLGASGVSRVINGPIPYTPDGLPLIGPMPGVPNAFEACVFTFGITQGGGAGKVLAEWITEGGTEWDMWAVDPRRFGQWMNGDQEYCNIKGMEVYGHEYAMHFPHMTWPDGRDKRLSPVHDKIVDMGGVMGDYNGWERANWFAKDGDDTSWDATQTWKRQGPWEARVKEEVEAVRDSAGILDLPGFSRFVVEGEGAIDWLRTLVAGPIARVGRIGLLYFPDEQGRILTEMSIIRLEENRFVLITAASAEDHDYEWLMRHRPDDAAFTITNKTNTTDTFIVAGPQSREMLAPIVEGGDLNQPWLTFQTASIAGVELRLVRVSFAGELGWEVHVPVENAAKVYDAIVGQGVKPFGMFALNSMRIEKGYRAWKGDLSTDYTLLEGGLERFVRLDNDHDFVGKQAIQAEKQRGVKKQFVSLKVDAGEYDAPYMSCIWLGDEIVGETTSGAWGYRVGHSVALGTVKTELAVPGTELEIEMYGERYKAVVADGDAQWDPSNERLRA